MNKEALKVLAKQLGHYVLAYFTHYLFPIIKESFLRAKDYFIDILWDSVKGEFATSAKSAVEYIEKYFNSLEYKEKEKEIIDLLFKNVDLPLLLKPFKPLLKKILNKKVNKLIRKYLKKLDIKS